MSTSFYDDPYEGIEEVKPDPVPNLEVIERWVTALESGKYGQTTGKLTDGEGNFCCLGVLCELAVEDKVIEAAELRQPLLCPCGDCDDLDGPEWYYHDDALMTPREVADWAFGAGSDRNPILVTGDDYVGNEPASGLNDGCGWDFKEIAAAIRRTYLEGNDVPGKGADTGQVPELAAS